MSSIPASAPHRVAVIGLGKLGQLFVERLTRRSDMEIVAAVDVDPAKVGRPLDEVLDFPGLPSVEIKPALEADVQVDAALVATASRLQGAMEMLEQLIAMRVNVVSTCEELAFPWRQFPQESRRLDELARQAGVSVVGCGSNPGFLMDLLPATFAFGCERVEALSIARTLDMRPHKLERLKRFGLGLTPADYDLLEERPYGHVGFTQSIDCVASVLGWELDERVEYDITPAVIADAPRTGTFVTLDPGTVAVIEHRAVGLRDGEKLIELTSYFGFHEPGDPIFHGDVYEITASDHPIRLEMAPSWSPFTGTPSTCVNIIGPLRAAEPGLRSTVDFPARLLGGNGRGVSAQAHLPIDDYLVSAPA